MVFNPLLIDFFKRHNLYDKEMFDYFSNNSTMIDFRDPDQRPFIGCFSFYKPKNYLHGIHLNVPYVYDEITMLISIHEIVHAITLYSFLNKKVKLGIEVEVLPMLYEKLYIKEVNSPKLLEYEKYLNSKISNNDREYIIGLQLVEQLIIDYDFNINKIKKKTKKLIKKYYN